MSDYISKYCEPCKDGQNETRDAAKYCALCKESLCENCAKSHKSQKATRNHELTNIEEYLEPKTQSTPATKCEPCSENDVSKPATQRCVECEESYCDACARIHRSQKATRNHEVTENTRESARAVCDACAYNDIDSPAAFKCITCDEVLCTDCTTAHKSQKATRMHTLQMHGHEEKKSPIPEERSDSRTDNLQVHGNDEGESSAPDASQSISNANEDMKFSAPAKRPDSPTRTDCCDLCKDNQNVTTVAVAFCFNCRYTLCKSCADDHGQSSGTDKHRIAQSTGDANGAEIDEISPEDDVSDEIPTNEDEGNREDEIKGGGIDRSQPGKPGQVGALKVDSITIKWTAPDQLFESCSYQVRFKETASGSKWQYYDEDKTSNTSLIVKNLKSHSAFLLQVRMVNNEAEGPYSEISDPIETLPSASELVLGLTHEMYDLGSQLKLRQFRLNENTAGRNSQLKTRKLILGEDPKFTQKEKTILLLGASGTGKTTFVDGLVNYIFGITFADNYRFSIIDTAEDEIDIDTIGTKAPPKTNWITCYTVYPVKGSKIDYSLTIIDTPGFGDKGIERDTEIKQQLKELFSAVDEKGVLFVDAVCIFMKASESRLTVTQEYIYTSITSLFHKDIEENICSVITFSDGKAPPVLSALRDAKLPHETYFPFNTTEMFADQLQTSQTSLTKVFFELNVSSFESFIKKLGTLKTKSLSQSNEVLQKRQQIEETAATLLSKVESGLNKMEECKSEIAVLEKYKSQMEDNKDFTYKRKKFVQNLIPLDKGKHTTNCLHCNVTCHDNCMYANDEDKARCSAMDVNGYCMRCEDHCFWNEHKNTPFIIEWELVEEECTYEEMKQKYQKASDEVLTHEGILEKMKQELDKVEQEMLNLMKNIADCSNQLSQMALRANPLSVAEHIDIIIENEKWHRKPGFQERINNLEKLKRRIAVGDEFENFQKSKEEIYKNK